MRERLEKIKKKLEADTFANEAAISLGLPVPHKSMLDFLVPIRYGARHGVPEPSHP